MTLLKRRCTQIGQFKRVKFDFAKKKMYPVDKKMATLDLKTDEKGFTFKADGKTEIAAQEGDGQITLLAPYADRQAWERI